MHAFTPRLLALGFLLAVPFALLANEPTLKKVPLTAQRLELKARLSKDKVRPGEVFQVILEGQARPGFHTYPITKALKDQTNRSKLLFDDNPDFEPLPPLQENANVEEKDVPNVGREIFIKGPFTWTQEVLVSPKATAGTKTLGFTVSLVVCDDSCIPGKYQYTATIVVEGAPLSPSAETLARSTKFGTQPPTPTPPSRGTPTPPPTEKLSPAATPSTELVEKPESDGLIAFLIASAGAAFLMLLTPCVFPMIPITVSFFLKRSEQQHSNPLLTALVYSGTIIGVLTLAVLVLGQFIVNLANSPWLNLGLGAVLIFFALSLFGMYEIELPTFLTNWTSARQGQAGLAGTVFMALTFTITSFTCTGPFLGPLLASAAALKVSYTYLILGALTYSTVFAAPFFLLALFPTLLKKMPKSGGWMNVIKVVMGFLELAAAFKFLANTDLALFPGNPRLFTYDTVLCAWMGLSVLCGLYLLGVYRLPHDDPQETLSVSRMLMAGLFFGLAVYMWPALNREPPLGTVGEAIVAFLPLDTRPPRAGNGGGKAGEETWTRNLQQGWDQAQKENKLLFIDFTGVTCTNCRANENSVFPQLAVRTELERFVKVQLYTDWNPSPGLSRAVAEAQGEANMELQNKTFGDVTLPMYVVIRPEKGQTNPIGPDGKLRGEVLMLVKGLIRDSSAFADKLKAAQQKGTEVVQAK